MKSSPGPGASLPADLAHRLRRAGGKELMRLVSDHLRDFTLREVRQVLLNPHATSEVVEELLGARHLLSSYEMRAAVARHRKTPEQAAMRFIAGLYWRDLAEITLDVHIHPSVRRVAEKYLVQRLTRLTVGEKVSLARRSSGAVVAHLRHDPSLRVVDALLENPRLTEELLVPLATKSRSPRILDLLARHPRWGRRFEIRVALAKNGATPFRAALAILPILAREELAEIAGDEEQSSVVRNRARELLEELATAGAIDRPEETGIDSIKLESSPDCALATPSESSDGSSTPETGA